MITNQNPIYAKASSLQYCIIYLTKYVNFIIVVNGIDGKHEEQEQILQQYQSKAE